MTDPETQWLDRATRHFDRLTRAAEALRNAALLDHNEFDRVTRRIAKCAKEARR